MSYPSDVEDLLEDGRIAIRGLIRVTLGSGTYGFWNGTGNLVYAGVTYKPNSLISVDEPAEGLGTQESSLTIELAESQDFGITPDLLAQIENEDYKGRPIVISDAFFEPDTRNLLHVEPLFAGYIDTIEHVRDGGIARMIVNISTTALDNHRDGYRSASNADQQLVSPGDRFFEHAGMVRNETFKVTFPR